MHGEMWWLQIYFSGTTFAPCSSQFVVFFSLLLPGLIFFRIPESGSLYGGIRAPFFPPYPGSEEVLA